LYNFVNKPYKTQEKVRQILTELYTNDPAGISGNEDCGQMSAWYVLSSMGFYSVTPASNQYIIGAPLFPKATINLENGKTFTIVADSISKTNAYIKSVELNGREYPYTFLKHKDIVAGGSLRFVMTDKPSSWGTSDSHIPVTEINEHLIVAAPFIEIGEIAFKGKTTVALNSVNKNATIYYSIGEEFKKYEDPIVIVDKVSLKMYAQKGDAKSATITTEFFKIDPNIKIELKTKYANQYNAGGDNALIDGIIGAQDFRTGTWQGYSDVDLHATVDLGKQKDISSIGLGFLEDQRSWIFLPTKVEMFISSDNKRFTKVATKVIDATKPEENVSVKKVEFSFKNKKARYIKVIAKKLGVLPTWHLGYKHDGRSWLFVDEIQIK